MTGPSPADRSDHADRPDPVDRDPVSVVLPTTEWGPVAEALADQVRPALGDELLVVCDASADPLADRRGDPDLPAGVEVLVAGEPEGCSAKANALAHGMDRAGNDRFVWTDDDYRHGEDWLDRLVAAGRDGPAAVLPFFVGGGWWAPAEPALALLLGARHGLLPALGALGPAGDGGPSRATGDGGPSRATEEGRSPLAGPDGALAGLRDGDLAGFPWGGGVTFARGDLDRGVDALLGDLRRGFSDDLILDEHLDGVAFANDRPVPVEVDGDARAVVDRLRRWSRGDHVHRGVGAELAVACAVAAVAALVPVAAALAVTLGTWAGYRVVGVPRRTYLLAYPALFLLPAILAAGVLVREVPWNGRRYRVDGPRDVTVLDD